MCVGSRRLRLKKPNRILSLDIATNTGWAVADLGKDLAVSDISYGSVSFEAPSYGLRFINSRQFFGDMLRKYKPSCVVFEMVKNARGAQWAQLFNGYLSQLLIACEEVPTPYYSYAPTEWKKKLSGSGNTSKDDVAGIVQKATDIETDDRDASDALGILLVFLADPMTSFLYSERQTGAP